MPTFHNSSYKEPLVAVIPAYNESLRIPKVLEVLCEVRELAQIIVVDDCSTDTTPEIVRSFRQHDPRTFLLRLQNNTGKGGAMVAGAEASPSDLIIFLDADLVGLHPEDVLALARPVQERSASMTLGLFSAGRLRTDWSHRMTPFLSGQRCLRWSLYQATPDLSASRWGAEVALSLHAWRHHYPVANVVWHGVTHVMQSEKHDRSRGLFSYGRMYIEILNYVTKHMVDRQNPSRRYKIN